MNGVAETSGALAYFGYAYYVENKDRLKLVAIDSGRGCVDERADSYRVGRSSHSFRHPGGALTGLHRAGSFGASGRKAR